MFGEWWDTLDADEQVSVDAVVRSLETMGPGLPYPHSSGLHGSKHRHMRELRIQHQGNPYRVLYAFDPRRVAILLLGGAKRGGRHWCDRMIPIADHLYDQHLRELEPEDPIDG
jgi:hypothetical protein